MQTVIVISSRSSVSQLLPEHGAWALRVPGEMCVPNPAQEAIKEKVKENSNTAVLNKVRNSSG